MIMKLSWHDRIPCKWGMYLVKIPQNLVVWTNSIWHASKSTYMWRGRCHWLSYFLMLSCLLVRTKRGEPEKVKLLATEDFPNATHVKFSWNQCCSSSSLSWKASFSLLLLRVDTSMQPYNGTFNLLIEIPSYVLSPPPPNSRNFCSF